MTSYGDYSKQESSSGKEHSDGRTHRRRTVIVATNIIWKKKEHLNIKGKCIDEAK